MSSMNTKTWIYSNLEDLNYIVIVRTYFYQINVNKEIPMMSELYNG